MKVPLDKIGPDGYDLDTKLELPWMAELLRDAKAPFEAVEPGELSVRLDRAGEVVHVRGDITVHLSTPCGRCLRALTYDIEAPIEVAMFPLGSEPSAGEEGELESDDLGVSTYEHKEIDLTNLVRDEIFLEMPMNPVCEGKAAESCVAAIPAASEPEKPKTDPRWDALKSIKLS